MSSSGIMYRRQNALTASLAANASTQATITSAERIGG